MAAPAVPSSTTICTEALKRCGYTSPSAAQLTRAADWLEEIKLDIWLLGKRLKPLMEESVQILTGGIARYDFPATCSSILDAKLLIGDEALDVTGAAAASVTLDTSDETGDEDDIEGHEILILTGTGAGSMARCYSYNTTTFVASVSPAWTATVGGVAPIATDTYIIVRDYKPLKIQNVTYFDEMSYIERGPSEYMHPVGDDNHYGYYYINPIPDDDYYYGLYFRYFINLLTLDLASARITTLYQRWRNLWIEGIKYRQWQEDEDSRWQNAQQMYLAMVKDTVKLETYGRHITNYINQVTA